MKNILIIWGKSVPVIRSGYCKIIFKESIRFRAATKRAAYTKDKVPERKKFPFINPMFWDE